MIHIIGTCHSLQVWTDAKRKGDSLDVSGEMMEAFEHYLTDAAKSLKAESIAEEMSEERMLEHGGGASSVAKDITKRLGIKHLFCEPTREERRQMGHKVGEEFSAHANRVSQETGRDFMEVRQAEQKKQFPDREAFWLKRLESLSPNDRSVVFVCGADHVDSFKKLLHSKKIHARIHCRDWKEEARKA